MKAPDLVFALLASFQYREYDLPSLIKLADVLGIKEPQLRTTLSRMHANGLLQSRKEGKRAFYRLSSVGERVQVNVIAGLRVLHWNDWDGKWRGVFFTVPEEDKPLRHRIRQELSAYRFAPLYPGFWTRPRHQNDQLDPLLNDLRPHCRSIVFDFSESMTVHEAASLWKLETINKEFAEGLTRLESSLSKGEAAISPEEAYKQKMLVGDPLVKLLYHDPLLPPMLLPVDWHANELKKALTEWNQSISPLANAFVHSMIAEIH